MNLSVDPLRARFADVFGGAPTFLARAPGRVNLIGEHTDYNEGFVLPMAIDRRVAIYGRPRLDRRVRLYSANFDQLTEFDLGAVEPSHQAPWSNYCRGVAWSLEQAGHSLNGFDGLIYGDVPVGSGLSSSAAIEMATLAAFQAATPGLEVAPLDAARLAQRAENEFVGVKCGIMDQLIAALGREGHALLIDCRSLEHQPVPMPTGVTVLVIDTSAPRNLAASAYNERRAQCEQAAHQLGVRSLRDLSPEAFERGRHALPELLAKRAAHVVYENARVLDAVQAMRAGELARLGELMNQSHDSLRDQYEVSSAALDAAVEIARSAPGVYGARMTGAGFGGCAIALVQNDAIQAVSERLLREYPARTGLAPKVYPCAASEGARWQALS